MKTKRARIRPKDEIAYDVKELEKFKKNIQQSPDGRRATLGDIARIAGCSKMTVSRVLNNNGQISSQIRSVVETVAAELEYVANVHYTQIRRSSTKVSHPYVGLLLPSHGDEALDFGPYIHRLLSGIERAVRASGYTLVVSTVEDSTTGGLPRVVSEDHVDGLIVTNYVNADLYRTVNAVVPVVLANLHFSGFGFSSVSPSEESTIRQGLDYLTGLGHTKIAFFAIDDSDRTIPDRRWGFTHHNRLRRRIFDELTLGPNALYPLTEAHSIALRERGKSIEDTAYDLIGDWIASGTMPTALISADIYAEAFMNAAQRHGIRVPEDFSVLGIDDTDICNHLHPKLSSIRQPLEKMGLAAVKILIDRIADPSALPISQKFEVELIERESCSAVNTAKRK